MITFPDVTYFRIVDAFVTDIVLRLSLLIVFFVCYRIATRFTKEGYQSDIKWTPQSAFIIVGLSIFIEHFLLFLFKIIGKLIGGEIGYYISPFCNVSRRLQGILMAVIILAITIYAIKIKYHQFLIKAGFHKDKLVFGVIWGVAISLLYCWLIMVTSKYRFESNYETYLKSIRFYLNISTVLSMVIFLPIAEEFLFRGYVYQAFKKDISFFWAAVFSSLLFVISHAYFQKSGYITGTFIVGFITAFLFYKSGSLISCIIFHAASNLTQIMTNYKNGYIFEIFNWYHFIVIGVAILFVSLLLFRYSYGLSQQR